MRRLLGPEALSGLTNLRMDTHKATTRLTTRTGWSSKRSGFFVARIDVSVIEIAMNVDKYANLRLAAWRDALQVLAFQFAASIAAAIIGMFGWNPKVGLGALIGAGIGLIANVYLAVAMLGKPLARQQPGSVMINWLVRVGLILSLVIIVMRANFVPPLAVIIGLAVVSLAHWIAVSFWLSGRR
jgi:ATP synthase I chain